MKLHQEKIAWFALLYLESRDLVMKMSRELQIERMFHNRLDYIGTDLEVNYFLFSALIRDQILVNIQFDLDLNIVIKID